MKTIITVDILDANSIYEAAACALEILDRLESECIIMDFCCVLVPVRKGDTKGLVSSRFKLRHRAHEGEIKALSMCATEDTTPATVIKAIDKSNAETIQVFGAGNQFAFVNFDDTDAAIRRKIALVVEDKS